MLSRVSPTTLESRGDCLHFTDEETEVRELTCAVAPQRWEGLLTLRTTPPPPPPGLETRCLPLICTCVRAPHSALGGWEKKPLDRHHTSATSLKK